MIKKKLNSTEMKELQINEAYNRNKTEVIEIFSLFMESIRAVKVELVTLDKSHTKYINERAFAYELYRQISNRLYKDVKDWGKWQDEDHIVVNAEIYKRRSESQENDNGVYPDIVIHGGQENTDKQILICEIKKMASSEAIKEDVDKLLTYMDYDKMSAHPYPLAVFVNVGPLDTFMNNLEKTMFNKPINGSLVFISYNKGNAKIAMIKPGKYFEISD